MLHAHYITTQRMASGYARCAYSVHCSQEEYEALFRGAPVMHNRVVAGWYDRAKNEVFMRRAGPGEIGVTIQQVRPPKNKSFQRRRTVGMRMAMFVSNNLEFPMPFLFGEREAAGRIVMWKGVPVLVWRMPTKEEVQPPRMRYDIKEKLYNPETNPSSDVRYITITPGLRAELELARSAPKTQPGKVVEAAKKVIEAAKPKPDAQPKPAAVNGNGAGHPHGKPATPLEKLKISIANVNALSAKIGGVQLTIEGGKLRASVITRVDL